jgi:hypothetical protein
MPRSYRSVARLSGRATPARRCDHLTGPPHAEVRKMCYERWMRRERRREERFDAELRHLLDEKRAQPEPPKPVTEHEHHEEPMDPERVRVEAGLRS